jgi:manganese efflux pump family protein
VGIGVSGVQRSVRVRVAVVFGLFETAMPIIGVLLGRRLAGGLGGAARWTGGALLVAAGAYALIIALRERRGPTAKREQEQASERVGSAAGQPGCPPPGQPGSSAPGQPGSPAPGQAGSPGPHKAAAPREWRGWRLLLSGAGLSVDNLAVGFALGTTSVPIVVSATVFGVVSVGMSLAGLELGAKIGAAVGERGELVAGLVLIAVGAVMAAGWL